MSDLNEIIPVENADARKDLLSEQFDEVVETTVDDTPEPVEIEEEEEPVEIVAEEQARTIEPPRSWKPEYKDVWDKIDPKVQGYIDQRESEMSRGYEQLKPRIELANQVEEVVQPYVNTMRELNIDTPTAIKGLLEADDLLRNGSQEEKEYYFARLAENYGINLNSVGTQAQPVDQNMYSLKNEVNSVRHEINSFKEQQKQEREELGRTEINKRNRPVSRYKKRL
jgi:hypothetical protein